MPREFKAPHTASATAALMCARHAARSEGRKSMKRPRTYTVFPGSETPEEPSSGIYWTSEDDAGDTMFYGPYSRKWEAEEAIDRWMFLQGEMP